MQILESALQVLRRLQENGFESFLVGGCVRDLLLERPVHDWDIATSARPEQITELFDNAILTGARFGTVTVLWGEEPFEVTTFRTDGTYLDGRRPEQVSFVHSLEADLARRDFTINAMAMDQSGQITDLFGGQADLRQRLIRCVGRPQMRFDEDGLRMLRALRFSAQLGFSVERQTRAAIAECAPLAQSLSAERVRDEVEKTICSTRPEKIQEFIRYGFLKRFGAETMETMPQTVPERMARWAALLYAAPQLDLKQLRLEKRLIQCCAVAVAACKAGRADLLELYAQWGEACAKLTAELDGRSVEYETLRRAGKLLGLGDLAVCGSDLKWLKGREIGKTLKVLLRHVQENPQDNQRQILLDLARGE